jgi:hypothetical protein
LQTATGEVPLVVSWLQPCELAGSEDREKGVPVPKVVAPFMKVIVPPLGVPVPGATGRTVAVSATDWP